MTTYSEDLTYCRSASPTTGRHCGKHANHDGKHLDLRRPAGQPTGPVVVDQLVLDEW